MKHSTEVQTLNLPECIKGSAAFRRFDHGMREILSVPHSTILRREKAYRKKVDANPNRPDPSERSSRLRLRPTLSAPRPVSSAYVRRLPEDLTDANVEPLTVRHLAIVKSESLFVNGRGVSNVTSEPARSLPEFDPREHP